MKGKAERQGNMRTKKGIIMPWQCTPQSPNVVSLCLINMFEKMKKEEEEELPLQSLSTANYKRFTMKLMYIKYMKNGKYKQ